MTPARTPPPSADDLARLSLPIAAERKSVWRAAAEQAGIPLTVWVERALNEAASRSLSPEARAA